MNICPLPCPAPAKPIPANSGSKPKESFMSVVQTAEPVIMTFTDNAAEKVHSLIAEEGNDKLKLRVFVTGGGCSGFQYGFTFDEKVNEVAKEVTGVQISNV